MLYGEEYNNCFVLIQTWYDVLEGSSTMTVTVLLNPISPLASVTVTGTSTCFLSPSIGVLNWPNDGAE